MASWSRKRRFIYAISLIVIAFVVIIVPIFLLFYKAPTCTDGILNGKELGVDCGGSCTRLCASAFLPPSVAWSRFEQVAPGLYNVGAYIINPNSEGEANSVPYRVMLYDSKGVLIIEEHGFVNLRPNRNTLAFIRTIDTGKRIPAKAFFELTGYPDWRSRKDPLSKLVIGEKNYSEDQNSSSLTVSLTNTDVAAPIIVSPDKTLAVYVVLYDINKNVIGFSKTFVDNIPSGQTAIAPFTWPFSRNGKVISIDVLPVTE